MTLWEGADLAIVVDAAHAHPGTPGRVHRMEPDSAGLAQPAAASSHGLGLGESVELARVLGRRSYRRVARFATAPLPGGDAAVRHPCRMALGHLFGTEPLGSPFLVEAARAFLGRIDARQAEVVRAMVARGVNCPRVSSAGRLFDTVASLLGLVDTNSCEGEAAAALEAVAGRERAAPLRHRVVRVGDLWVYDCAVTLGDLLERQASGEPVPRLAAAFHQTLAAATAELVARAVEEGAPRTVCLGGGCFTNVLLLTHVRRRLRALGLRVLVGREVPVGDGGISYGQAAVAAARLAHEWKRR
ncbi:hypothetical protein [Streptomyces spectabilis]|uniref:Kae1-like domain-containing protein n=1 Tax=Streptomyces spectabilis TaxID=68270 RepID=UPI00298F27C9|nr:hypothetical protein [Streptomyces spectabilis]